MRKRSVLAEGVLLAGGVLLGVLAVSTIVLGVRMAGEDSRTAENVCRSALLAITPTTAFDGPLRVRGLNSIDTAAESQVAEVVKNYAPSPLAPEDASSAYVVQGDVRFGHSEPTRLTCLIVLDGGSATTAPVFATGIE